MKHFASGSRAKGPLPSHKKAPERNSTTFMTTSRSKEWHEYYQDSLIAAFSRISVCIDFSSDFGACKELSVGVRALSTKPADEVEIQAR
jgi:hypothetical protein